MSEIIFFMIDAQLVKSQIKSVRLIEGDTPKLSKVLINKNICFWGETGFQAIDSLFECGFYTREQHRLVSDFYLKISS